MKHTYTEEMLSWIKDKFDKLWTYQEIAEGFSPLYFPVSKIAIFSLAQHRGWRRKARNNAQWSKNELAWLKEHYCSGKYTSRELVDAFNEYSHRNITMNGLYNVLVKNKWRNQKAGMWKKFTTEEERWLVEHYDPNKGWANLARHFGEKFFHVSAERVAHAVRLYVDVQRKNTRSISGEQRAWLIEMISSQQYTYVQIADMYNKKFDDRVMVDSYIGRFARSNGIAQSSELKHKTKVSASTLRGCPLGTIAFNCYGQPEVKVAKGGVRKQYNWKLQKIVNWEQFQKRKLPKGWWVVCIDGNEKNVSIENLLAVPKGAARSFYVIKTHNPHLKGDAEWGGAYLKLKELELILKDNKAEI